jgi:stage III sporulation protein AG
MADMSKFKKLLENKMLLMIILGVLTGALLIIFGSVDSDKNTDTRLPSSAEYGGQELESYTQNLEKRITELIERVGGVSNVSVLLTVDASNETVYATEGVNKDYVITKGKDGSEEAIRIMEINSTVRGIAVVCDYGGNEELRVQIIEMLSSLFCIGTNRISVMPC